MIEGGDTRLETQRVKKSSMLVFNTLFALLFVSASVIVSIHGKTFEQPSIEFPLRYYVAVPILVVACFLKNRTTLLPMIPPGLLLVAGVLMLTAMMSSILNVERAQAAIIMLLVQAALLWLCFYVVFTLRRAGVDPLRYFLRFMTIFGLASLVFAIVLFMRGSIWVGFATIEQFPGYMRLYGWYGNPNLFGSAMGIATLAAYALLMQGRSISVSRAVLFTCLFAGVVLSGSKAALASVVVSIGLVHVIEMLPRHGPGCFLPKKPWKLFALAALPFVACLPIFILHYDLFLEVLRLDTSDVTSGRLEMWREALDFVADAGHLQVLFGSGYHFHKDFFGFAAHSFYIRSLVEEGAIFVAVFTIANVAFLFILLGSMGSRFEATRNMAQFVFLVVLFMLLRNFATPSFLQVRVENLAYMFCIGLFFSSPMLRSSAQQSMIGKNQNIDLSGVRT